jgi:hypothetical protein
MHKYILSDYNDENYPIYISQSADHVIQLLKICEDLHMGTETTLGVIRLIRLKFMSCEMIDSSVVIDILSALPPLLSSKLSYTWRPYLALKAVRKNILRLIKFKMESSLQNGNEKLNHELWREINDSISILTKKTHRKMKLEIDRMAIVERLRQVIIKLVETMIERIAWNPVAGENIWQSFLTICDHIDDLGKTGIINHMDDLDDLHWCAVYSFTSKLKILAPQLPQGQLDEIVLDLDNDSVDFLKRPELDYGVKSKKEVIKEAVATAIAHSIANSIQKNSLDRE